MSQSKKKKGGSNSVGKPKGKNVKRMPKTAAHRIPWSARRWHLLVVLLLTIIALFPMLWNGFTNWDDILYVTQNDLLKSLNGEGLKAIFSTPLVSNYHPVTVLSLALNYQISGIEPFGFHLTSLMLHLVNTALVYLFMYKLSDRKHWVSLGVAFFFAIHPMHVESVAWISERKDLLYTMFYLGALILYLDYIKIGGIKKLILVALLFILSMLSKPAAVVLPIVLLLLDYYKQRPFKPIVILEKIPLLVLSVIFGIIAIEIQSERAIASVDVYSVLDRISFAGFGSLWYVVKMLIPHPLSALHPFPLGDLSILYKVAPFVSLALLAAMFFWVKSRLLNFGILFYLVNVALVLQLLSVGSAVVAERYTYVSYLGLFFMVGMFLDDKIKHSENDLLKKLTKAGLIVLGVGFSLISFFRTQVWENSEVLWNDALKTYPTSHRAWTNRGLHYYGLEQYNKAIADMEEALKHKPNYVTGIEWLGKSYYQGGKFQSALEQTNLFLKYKPDSWQGLSDKAKTLGSLNRYEEALKLYNKAFKINPNNTEILNNRGTMLFNQMKEYDKALKDFNRAIKIQPNKGIYYVNRARCYYMLGDVQKAKKDVEVGERLGGRVPDSFKNLLNQ